MQEFFDSIIAKGGEGVILREPQSMYKAGRSDSLRKYKPYFDAEVRVIENNYPHGFQCKQYEFLLFCRLLTSFTGRMAEIFLYQLLTTLTKQRK